MKSKKIINKKNRFVKVILILFVILLIFYVYSNLNLAPKREYVYFGNLSIGNDTIIYNSNLIKGTEPIFFNHGNEKAILLLHGMGGTPIEMRELAEYLFDKNISVFVPLLSNQGRTYDELGNLNAEALYNESLEYVKILQKYYSEVYVGGLSTGGSLALKLGENENLSGIITYAAPVTYGADFLGSSTLYFFKLIKIITPNVRRIEYGLARNSSIADLLPSFDRLPVNVLLQGEALKQEVKSNLPKINEPILILQSNFDNRAAPSSAQYIYDYVSSEDKTLVYLNNSGHVITLDYDKEIIFEETYEFINRN